MGSDGAAGLRLNYELLPRAGLSSLSTGKLAWGLQAASFLSLEWQWHTWTVVAVRKPPTTERHMLWRTSKQPFSSPSPCVPSIGEILKKQLSQDSELAEEESRWALPEEAAGGSRKNSPPSSLLGCTHDFAALKGRPSELEDC